MELKADIYAWLTSIELLSLETQLEINDDGFVELGKEITTEIYSGCFFTRLFEHLNNMMNALYGNIYRNDPKMYNLVLSDDIHVRLKNWASIAEVAANFYSLEIDSDRKTLLIASDRDEFNKLFEELLKIHEDLSANLDKKKEKRALVDNSYAPKQKIALPPLKSNELNLEEFNIGKELENCRSILEFIIASLGQSLSMNTKQVMGLMADNQKYLHYAVKKGIKGQFEPILDWYQMVFDKLDHFIKLFEFSSIYEPDQVSKNINQGLSCLNHGLTSKNTNVVLLSAKILSKIAYDLTTNGLISAAWEWFVAPNGGLETCTVTVKKNSKFVDIVVSLIGNFGRMHIYELFSVYLKSYLVNESEYMSFVSEVLKKLSKLSFFTEIYEKQNLKSFFIEYARNAVEGNAVNSKVAAATLLGQIWVNFPFTIEEKESLEILREFKRLSRDENRAVKFNSISQMFYLLLEFGKQQNKFAPTIYKSLVFQAVENHSDFELKNHIMSNFLFVFKHIVTMPPGILLEPLSKQIHLNLGKSYVFNTTELRLFEVLSNHPRLTPKDAVYILDVMAKVYFEEVYLTQGIRRIFTKILSRYLTDQLGIEFTIQLIKISLEAFCNLDKENSVKIYSYCVKNNINPIEFNPVQESDFDEDPDKFRDQMAKYSVLALIMDILQINNSFLNKYVKSLIVIASLRHRKIYLFDNPRLNRLLQFFGNPADVLYYYNINKEEIDMDNEFETAMEIVFDKQPEVDIPRREVTLREGSKRLESIPERRNSVKKATIKKTSSNTQVQPNRQSSNTQVQPNRQSSKHLPPLNTNALEPSEPAFSRESIRRVESKKSLQSETYQEKPKTIGTQSKVPKKGLSYNFEYLDLSSQEDREIIEIKKLLKDYARFFKAMFQKYTASIYQPVKGKMFNSIKEINETISLSEFAKFLKDHDFFRLRYLLTEEVNLILTKINKQIFKKSSIRAGFNYDEFVECNIQIAFYMFTKPPFNYPSSSIKDMVLKFIRMCEESAETRELPTDEYKHPDELLEKKERYLIDYYNAQLKSNSFMEIPEDYEKYLDTELNHYYKVPDAVHKIIGTPKKIAIELVDEIINKALNIHTLQSLTRFKESYKVKRVIFYKNNKKDKRLKTPNRRDKLEEVPVKLGNINMLRSAKFRNKKTQNPVEDSEVREIFNEIATEDNQSQKSGLVSNRLKSAARSEDAKSQLRAHTIKIRRQLEEERKKREMAEKEKRRLQRVQFVKQQLREQKEKKLEQERKKAEKEAEANRKIQAKQLARQKKEEELRDKIKEELKKIKEEKELAKKLLIEKEKADKEKERKQNAKRAHRVLNQNKEFLSEQFGKLKEYRKIEEERLKERKQREEAKKKEVRKKQEKFLEEERKIKEFETRIFNDVNELDQKDSVKQVILKFQENLRFVFDCFSSPQRVNERLMSKDGFNSFCVNFGIVGGLLGSDEILFVFKKVSSLNKVQSQKISNYFNFTSFKKALVYIVLLAVEKFVDVPLDVLMAADNEEVLYDENLERMNVLGEANYMKQIEYFKKVSYVRMNYVNKESVSNFLDFLGMEIPFNKTEMLHFVNNLKIMKSKERHEFIKKRKGMLVER